MRLLLLWLIVTILVAPVISQAQVAPDPAGATAGEASVSSGGSANYQIKLSLPPGIADMVPDLTLQYSSQGGNGPLGVGWTLGGFPAIQRCPKNLANDNVVVVVKFTNNDSICLDSEPLLRSAGGQLQDGSIYRTLRDTMNRVRAYGTSGAGPLFFEIEAKTGRKLTFGSTPESRVYGSGSTIYSWHLSKVTDQAGNYFTIDYANDPVSGEILPAAIDYTANDLAQQSAQARVEFDYDPRPDPIYFWLRGRPLHTLSRLRTIRTEADGSVVREYRLGYKPLANAADRSELEWVQECGFEGAIARCLPETRFTWDPPGSPGWTLRYTEASAVDWDTSDLWMALDVMGIGRAQLVAVDKDSSSAVIRVFDRAASGSLVEVATTPTGWTFEGSDRWFGGDVDADGLLDLFAVRRPAPLSTSREISVWRSVGDGTFELLPGPAFVSEADFYPLVDPRPRFVADVDGDGRSDVVFLASGAQQVEWWVVPFKSDGAGAFSKQPSTQLMTYLLHSGEVDPAVPAADFNGDGRLDAYAIGVVGSNFKLKSMQWGESTLNEIQLPQNQDMDAPLTPDLNGDGKSDLVVLHRVTASSQNKTRIRTALGEGDGSYLGDDFDPLEPTLDGWPSVRLWFPADLNLDGREDLLRVIRYGEGNPPTIERYLSTGDGDVIFAGSQSIPGAPYPVTGEKRWLAGDLNGDGVTDPVLVRPNGGAVHMYVFESTNVVRDQIVGIRNGLGEQVVFQYAVLSNPHGQDPVYEKGSGAAYPDVDIQPAQPVVSALLSSNGIGGFHETQFAYAGLRGNARGRGILGFAERIELDVESGVETTTFLRQDFRFQGFEGATEVRVPVQVGSAIEYRLVSRIVNDWLDPGQLSPNRIASLRRRVEESWELDGTPIRWVETCQEYDQWPSNPANSWGNPELVMKTTRLEPLPDPVPCDPTPRNDQFRETTEREFLNTANSTTWKIGLLDTIESTYEAPDVPAMSRKHDYAYWPNGLLRKESLDYLLPLALHREYFRNEFGLIASTVTTGADIETRTESTDWTDDGRFPETVTNAENHPTTRQYSGRFGTVESEIDANGVAVAWQYDPLGRIKKEDRIGTQLEIDTFYDAGGFGCGRTVAMTIRRTSTTGAETRSLIDVLGREVCRQVKGFDGRWAQVETNYDAQGRVASVSQPYYEGDPVYLTMHEYDVLDRVVQTSAPQPGSGGPAVTTWDYFADRTVVTNAKLQTRTQYFDALGRIVRVVDDLEGENHYKYDAMGNLREVRGPTNEPITNIYDVRGRKTATIDPDRGTHAYQYDQLDLLRFHSNGRSKGTTYTYDKLGRLKTRTDSDEFVSTWTWDTASNGKGRLHTVTQTGTGYSRTYEYDSLGRPTKESVHLDNVPFLALAQFDTEVTYDSYGRLYTKTYPGQAGARMVTRSVYNERGYLWELRDHLADTLLWRADATAADGQLEEELLGNGVETTRTIQPQTGQLVGIEASVPGLPLLQNDVYDWDKLGNLVLRSTSVPGFSRAEEFVYDELNRMKAVKAPGIGGATYLAMGYDAAGNITSKSDVGAYSQYGAGSAGPHAATVIAGGSFSYDLDGNQTYGWLPNGANRSISWFTMNKPSAVQYSGSSALALVDFLYNPEEELFREAKLVYGGGTSEYTEKIAIGKDFELTQSLVTGVTEYRTHLRVDDRMIAIRTQKKTSPSGPITQTTLRYAHTDHLGSIVALSDGSGSLVDRDEFDAWGKRRPVAAGTQELLTVAPSYTGHRQLDDIGLVHMGGRIYDPVLGRFLSPDPYVQFPTDTQGWNRYTYVLNNPLSYTDPTGYNLFSRIGRWFDRLFSKIGRWTRSFMKKYGSYVAMAAVFVPPAWPGAAAAAAAIAAGASALQVAFNGGSLEQILFAGAIAGLGAWTGAAWTADKAGVIVNWAETWKERLTIGIWASDSARAGTILAGKPDAAAGQSESTHPMWRACNGGSATACAELEARNREDLARARSFIKEYRPEILEQAGDPEIRWDATEEFWMKGPDTEILSGDVTLPRAYLDVGDLAGMLAHELRHSGEGVLGRIVTFVQGKNGERHRAIYAEGLEITDAYRRR